MDRNTGGTELGYGSGFVGNVNPNQPSISPQATYPVLTGSGQGDSGGVIQGLSLGAVVLRQPLIKPVESVYIWGRSCSSCNVHGCLSGKTERRWLFANTQGGSPSASKKEKLASVATRNVTEDAGTPP